MKTEQMTTEQIMPAPTRTNQLLRDHALWALNGDGAHLDFDAIIQDFPAKSRGLRPKGGSHSPWELLEHLRICQRDVIDWINNPNYVSPDFPAGYWPTSPKPSSDKAWDESANAFRSDLKTLVAMAESRDLLAPLPVGDGQTILRKILMIADHNAYHLGQLLLLKQVLQYET
jgi:hypothetical protein